MVGSYAHINLLVLMIDEISMAVMRDFVEADIVIFDQFE